MRGESQRRARMSAASLGTVTLLGYAACGPAQPARVVQAAVPTARSASSLTAPALVAKPPIVISILGLNDLHGRIQALPAFAGYLANVRRQRQLDGAAIAVDAGDMFQGTLESNLTQGASVLLAYAALGMTSVTLGNHEFDFGPASDTQAGAHDPQGAIRARIAEARFPVVSANLIERASGKLPAWVGLQSSALLSVAGVKVGFVGVLTAETPSIVMPAQFVGLDVAPLAPAIDTEAKRLRAAGAELVVVLAHAGADCKRFDDPSDISSCVGKSEIFEVARALPAHSVDAIVAGHTHAGVAQVVNGIPIVEAYARGAAFSRVDLQVDGVGHGVLGFQVYPPHDLCPKLVEGGGCALGEYEGAPVIEDAHMREVIAPALALAKERRNLPLNVTSSARFSSGHKEESALGNLFADLLREALRDADAALVNGGTLRADLPAGELRYGDLFEAVPFDNHVARVRIRAGELRHVLEAHVAHDNHGIVSIAGLRAHVRCDKSNLRVTLTRVTGAPVRDDTELVLATSDYLATGGDELFAPIALTPDRVSIDPALGFRDALAQSLKKRGHISPTDPTTFDPKKPRMVLPSARPVHCGPP